MRDRRDERGKIRVPVRKNAKREIKGFDGMKITSNVASKNGI